MPIQPLQLPSYAAPSLANLGTVYREAQNRQKLSDLGKGLADGSIDYRQGAGSLAELGQLEGSLKLLSLAEAKDKLGRETEATNVFNRTVGGILSPQSQLPAPTAPGASAPATTTGAPQRMSNVAPGRIYGNDKPSPLDPPSGLDRDRLARTVIAEAGNQGPTGMNAVASVVRNRTVNGGYGGDTAAGVVTAPNQFEPWNSAEGRAKMAAIDPNSPEYVAATRAIDGAYSGNDPTNGAVNFYSPKAQAALGRPAPSWDNGTGQDIGGHRFFGGAQGDPSQRPYDVAGPTTAAPSGNAPGAPAAPQPSAANNFQGLNASHIPMLLQARSNTNLPAGQREFADKLLNRALDDSKPTDKVKTLNEMKALSGYTGSILDLEKELRGASKPQVTVDQRGESEEAKAAGKGAGERRATMFASAGAASKTLQSLSRMETLLDQVSQGRIEPGRITISAWAKSFGMNDEVATSLGLDPKGVGSAQALQSLVNEAVIGKIGAGQFPANNFSNADREFITQIFPNLGDDPRANKIRIETMRRVAQLDLQRARDYQGWKKGEGKNGGFEDFEVYHSDRTSQQDIFGDLRKQAEAVAGPPRNDIGGTLSNPSAAPSRQPQQPSQGRSVTPNGIGWSIN